MKIVEISVKNPILILMATCAAVFIGMTSLQKLKIDLFPKINIPVLVVMTPYQGAAPREIEENVTRPLEEAMAKVEKVKRISSVVVEGASYVIVEFPWGTNMDLASLDVRDNIDRVKSRITTEADESVIQRQDFNSQPVVWVNLTGSFDQHELKDIAEDDFKNQLERLDGVSSVDIVGGLTREIQVQVDPKSLRGHNLSIQDVINALKTENLNQRGGRLKEGKTELLVRSIGRFQTVDEINDVIVTSRNGIPVYIKDLAEVRDTFAEQRSFSRLDQSASVGILIYKESDGNTVDVAQKTLKRVEEIKKDLKTGVVTSVVFDQSEYINESIAMVKEAAITGSILAVVVLFLFLADWRSTLIIALAIPLSVIPTFGLIFFKGMTLNLLTLAGLALGVGMVVDNSIVVLENIFRHMQEGQSVRHSSISGPNEVFLAVMASTLTTLAVFLPIAYVEGIAGEIFADLAFAVAFSLFFSILVAYTIVPTVAARFLKKERHEFDALRKKIYAGLGLLAVAALVVVGYFSFNISFIAYLVCVVVTVVLFVFRHGFADVVMTGYKGMMSAIMAKWYWKAAVFVALGLSLLLAVNLKPGMQFFPSGHERNIQVTTKLPVGSSLEVSDRAAKASEEYARAYPEVESVATKVEPDTFSLNLKFPKGTDNNRVDDIVLDLQNNLAQIPDTVTTVKKASGMHSHEGQTDMEILVKGDDLEVLKDLAAQLLARIKNVEGVVSPDISYQEGRPELQVYIDKKKAADRRLNTQFISSLVQSSVAGDAATKYREGEKEYDILVQTREADRQSRADIANLPLSGGALLSDVAKLVWQRGPVKIERADQRREIKVTANVKKGFALGDIMQKITNQQKTGTIDDIVVPNGYVVEFGGSSRDMQEAFGELFKALIIAIILVYMVMAAQFGNLMQPFIILFTIPLSIVGVFIGLWLADLYVSITAMVGIIMLAGIVVNNAILLIDFVNVLRERGVERAAAIVQAGVTRFRPIMMTTLTTVLGMMPMALGLGSGVEFYRPLAVTVIGGLIFSTLLSLVLVPTLYEMADMFLVWLKKWSYRVFIGKEMSAAPTGGETESAPEVSGIE